LVKKLKLKQAKAFEKIEVNTEDAQINDEEDVIEKE